MITDALHRLREYVRHRPDCAAWTNESHPAEWRERDAEVCSCGLSAVLATVPGEPNQQQVEAEAQLQWIARCLEGGELSGFAESFPLVRAVADLKRATVPGEGPEPTLRDLAQALGWGDQDPSETLRFAIERERLLRVVQDTLEAIGVIAGPPESLRQKVG